MRLFVFMDLAEIGILNKGDFMKLLLLIGLLVSSVAHATYIPTDCKLTIGGRCFTAAEVARFDSNTVTAGGGVTLTNHVLTSTRFSYLHIPSAPATAFQVGAAVTLRCVAGKLITTSAAAAGAELSYSDDAATFDDTTMTNIVFQNGNASAPTIAVPGTGWNAAEVYWGSGFTIPANKYPSFQAAGAVVSLTVYCFID